MKSAGAPVDDSLLEWRSCKIGLFIPKEPALSLSLSIRNLALWFPNKHYHKRKTIVSLLGKGDPELTIAGSVS